MPATVTEFTVRPNSACNDGSWRWVFAALAVLGFAIAIRFALLGFWLILPFTVVEIALLGLVLWTMLERSAWVEKVRISEAGVEIRHLEKDQARCRSWRFPPGRAQVRMRSPARRWYLHRLVLGCADQWVEIGGCLTDHERRALAGALRGALARNAERTTGSGEREVAAGAP